VDCLADAQVRKEALGALDESSRALQAECHFSADEMARWNEGVVYQTNNPTLGDRVSRQAADPMRKLRREDRLIGPILLARKHAIPTPHLVRATAVAFLYRNACDPSAVAIQERIVQCGIEVAVREICQLGPEEEDVVTAVVAAYAEIKNMRLGANATESVNVP
jgi:mannitol-1-phosphate 5-dehydrogenase